MTASLLIYSLHLIPGQWTVNGNIQPVRIIYVYTNTQRELKKGNNHFSVISHSIVFKLCLYFSLSIHFNLFLFVSFGLFFSQAMLDCDRFNRSKKILFYRTTTIRIRMQRKLGPIWLRASTITCWMRIVERFWFVVKRISSICIAVRPKPNSK